MFWITTLTPTFLNELLDLPRSVSKRVTKKLKLLEDDPYSAGGDAKKLQDQDNRYRIRIGDYRVFYSIGENVVKVLSVRKRDDRTYSETPTTIQIPKAVITENQSSNTSFKNPKLTSTFVSSQPPSLPTPLPKIFTNELLQQWQIPKPYWPQLTAIATEEDLLSVELPERYLNRVLDNLFPRSIEEIETQPAYLLNQVEDLDKFLEGDVTDFLLKLDPDQEKLKDFGSVGPVLVKGGPGTGKSTLALYRIEKLIRDKYSSILFTTYTNALVNYSQQLLQQLLQSPPLEKGVRVSTVDWLAMEYYKAQYGEPKYAKNHTCKNFLDKAFKQAIHRNSLPGKNPLTRRACQKSLERLGLDYLLEEIETVILGQGITNLEDYLATSRRGRGQALTQNLRQAIWILYEIWCDQLQKMGLTTWEQVRFHAWAIAQQIPANQKPYQAIIVDEAQDLSPVALRFLLALVADFSGIYLTADASQSLYQKGFSWKQIHEDLNVIGRTLLLKRNYRNTQQIAIACQQILDQSEAGDQDCIRQTLSPYQGEKPSLLSFCLPQPEIEQIKQFLFQSAKRHRLPISSAAILCPTNDIAKGYAKSITEAGLNANFVSGQDIDIKAPYIKVLTLHSAKGLEFPFVIVALARSNFPKLMKYTLPEEEMQVFLDGQRRLFYVGCTRAMRELLVTLPQATSTFFDNLACPPWQNP